MYLTMGDIYCLTSPSGKKYVGQARKMLSSGKKWGYLSRWRDHISDSKTKNFCRLLNKAIRKYGHENFTIELICECELDELNDREQHYIMLHNTVAPNGYNLTHGGSNCKQTAETQMLKSKSMIGKNVGKVFPKRKRKHSEDDTLPKYIRCLRNKQHDKIGYMVDRHPVLKSKSFKIKRMTLEENYNSTLNYLNSYQAEIS